MIGQAVLFKLSTPSMKKLPAWVRIKRMVHEGVKSYIYPRRLLETRA